MRGIVALVGLAMVLGAPLAAQNITSSVRGNLVDPSGAAVPGAECVLVERATGASLRTVSAQDGAFTFLSVLPGMYTLRVSAPGFKNFELREVVVTANETRALGTLALEVGEVRETVSVTAEASALQMASSERAGVVTGRQLQDIALRGRDFFALLATIPGVVDTTARREVPSPTAVAGTFINGARDNQKNIATDGIAGLDTGSNYTVHFQPNMDAIAEIRVLTSNYQAEFGRNSGGLVTVVTKSGTQQFHGSAYHYYRHESLNANSFFNNRTATPKSPYRYRISGYTVGGPVYIPKRFNTSKERLFFFWSQEYTGMRRDYGARFVNLPTELERNGDFSRSFDVNGALIAIRDPQSSSPFPGNLVPRARVHLLGQSILNFLPTPNYTDADPANRFRWNYRSVYSGNYPRRQDLVRVDSNLTPTLRMFYRFVRDKDEQEVPWGSWTTGAINYLLAPVVFGQPGKGHVAHLSKTFSPTLVNEFIYGKSYNRLYFDLKNPALADRGRMGNPPQWYQDRNPSANYIPNVTFGAVPVNAANVSLGNIPYLNWNDIYSFVDNLSKVWGAHSLKAGVYIERTGKAAPNFGAYRGVFNFGRDVNNPLDTNHGYSNTLTGTFLSYSEATARLDLDLWFWNVEWYVQDNWRISQRLTLDVGLRFYWMPPTYDKNQTAATFVPDFYDPRRAPALYRPARNAAGQIVAQDPLSGAFAPSPLVGRFVPGSGDPANGMRVGGKDGFPAGLYTTPALAYGPRFGFAYDVFGNARTALRGGFGMFQDRPQGQPTVNASGQPPLAYTPALFYGRLENYADASGVIGPSALSILLGRQKVPTTMNFSLGLQQQMPGMALDVAYVGSLSRHLLINRNINPIPMYARFDPANADPTAPGRALPDNFFRRYMGYGDITLQEFSTSSNYNSLQVSANRRHSRGLQYGLAYTWSRALGMGGSDYDALSPYFAPRQRNYGPLPHDRRHVFVVNYSYDVPGLSARIGWKALRWVLDEWQVSGITSFISGAPFTPGFTTTDGQDITGSTEGARISVVSNPRLPKSERTFLRNFRTEAFARPPRLDFGNAGVGMLTGPGINNWDVSITKRIPLGGEQRFLQFRTELFNVWNHTQFASYFTTARFDATGRQVDPNFGAYSSARDPRIIQLSLRLSF